jgi:hypothetical protein
VTAVSETVRELAQATQIPVVALSQLRRAERRDFTAEPSLEDLRQSGQIEQDAHAVLLLHRPRGVHPAGAQGGDAKSYFTGEDKMIIAKQPSGPAETSINGLEQSPELWRCRSFCNYWYGEEGRSRVESNRLPPFATHHKLAPRRSLESQRMGHPDHFCQFESRVFSVF